MSNSLCPSFQIWNYEIVTSKICNFNPSKKCNFVLQKNVISSFKNSNLVLPSVSFCPLILSKIFFCPPKYPISSKPNFFCRPFRNLNLASWEHHFVLPYITFRPPEYIFPSEHPYSSYQRCNFERLGGHLAGIMAALQPLLLKTSNFSKSSSIYFLAIPLVYLHIPDLTCLYINKSAVKFNSPIYLF